MKIILIVAILVSSALCGQFVNTYGVYLANINIQLPNLAYKVQDDVFQLFDGFLSQPTSRIRQVTLGDRILNADFNNDGYPDAAVILNVVHYQLGLFYNVVFVVLQDFSTGAYVTNGITLGTSSYKIDIFTVDPDTKKIIVGYLPGIRRGAPPSKPAITKLVLNGKKLEVESSNTITEPACYPF